MGISIEADVAGIGIPASHSGTEEFRYRTGSHYYTVVVPKFFLLSEQGMRKARDGDHKE